MGFANLFGSDHRENQLHWLRHEGNPVIGCGDGWNAEFVGPCSLVEEGHEVVLYAEGGTREHESIGLYRSTTEGLPLGEWTPAPENPILGPSAAGFDRGSVFDPAVIHFGGATLLYYSATSGGAHEFAELAEGSADDGLDDERIGVAVANVSGTFERMAAPVLGGRCPGVIEWRGSLYLFYVKMVRGGYRIFLARSSDGSNFVPAAQGPVFDVGTPGSWDSFTVTTPKVFNDGSQFVMLYAGDARLIDDPTGIGLAVSDDLLHWQRHPGNPVLVTGPSGEFDSVSVSSAIPYQVGGLWCLLYAGSDRSIKDGLHSQIGMASLCV
jgi:predicted GH43/DUF377 family glycosyl hydrolase